MRCFAALAVVAPWTLLLIATATQCVEAFAPQPIMRRPIENVCHHYGKKSNNDNESRQTNPIMFTVEAVADFFGNFDDIVDDFFYKRMGKGEIFYGKRKYKPSGEVEGKYNGMGLSDKLKIEMTREYKEYKQEQRKQRENDNKRKR